MANYENLVDLSRLGRFLNKAKLLFATKTELDSKADLTEFSIATNAQIDAIFGNDGVSDADSMNF